MKVLVTGGAGYIGSHVCVALQERGHQVTVLDSLVNSDMDALSGIAAITGVAPAFVCGDVRNQTLVAQLLRDHSIDAVMHFAALKDVEESCRQPLHYFDVNVGGTLTLLRAMAQVGVKRLVFSSSAAVYGNAAVCPISETAQLQPTSPYGRSKVMGEQLIEDVASADTAFRAACLRYFNPVGAHPSARLGERAQAQSNGLLTHIVRAASGLGEAVTVYGKDYPSVDGTGVRDFVHVLDVAHAHVLALEHLANVQQSITLNIGTGTGYSVLDVVRAFEQISGKQLSLQFAPRRSGDVAISFADPKRAKTLLGWCANFGIEQMCKDAWNRQMDLIAREAAATVVERNVA